MKTKARAKKGTAVRVLRFVAKYRFSLAFSVICAAASSVLALYIPILTGDAIDAAVGVGDVDFVALKSILAKFALCLVIIVPSQWIMALCNNRVAFGVVRDLRLAAFKKLQKLPISYIDSTARGDTVSRIISDADRFSDGLILGFSQLFTGLITIVGTIIFMFSLNWMMTLVVVLLTPLSLFGAAFIAKRTYSMFSEQSRDNGALTATIDETVENQKLIRAYGYEDERRAEFEKCNERLRASSLKAIFYSSLTNPMTRFVNSTVYAVIAGVGAMLAISDPVFTAGCLSGFLIYANQYTKPFNEISGVITELQGALAGASRIFELLDEPDVVDEGKTEIDKSKVNGEICFDGVCFSYDKSRELIKNLSFTARAGQRVAIVGHTGCGKTTIINLLMRFYDVDSGSISIDGIPVSEMPRETLRSMCGMVLQDTWIKNGTVRDNIALGCPDATDEEIIAAAKASHAHGFIKRLKNGYDTVINDRDGSLSQGQRQLICICRLMLRTPPILILDEATSSIDTRTEMKISDAFDKLMKGRTAFIVAHRLQTVRNADLILMMSDGNVIERGTHKELLQKRGAYWRLYNSQFE